MKGFKVNIVSQMVQLIINSFEDKPHPQKDIKRKLMLRHYKTHDDIFTKNDKPLLDGTPNVVFNYMKEDKTKDDTVDLDCMLYIHVKEL